MSADTKSDIPLILVSGLGATPEAFCKQERVFKNLVAPEWIPINAGESLPDYARRLAEEVDPGGPCTVGGLSYGGMLAHYMARHLETKACFLIGTIRGPGELPPRYRIFTPLLRYTPWLGRLIFFLGQLLARLLLLCFRWCIPVYFQSLMRMYVQVPAWWIARSACAILMWNDPSTGQPQVNRFGESFPVYHIHGANDPILPCRFTSPDRVIPNARHVITISHPDEVNQFLREGMDSIATK